MKGIYSISITIWFLLACVTLTRAQSLAKQADRHYQELAYKPAIELYEKSLSGSVLTETERSQVLEKLGDCYRKVRDSDNAERIYRILLDKKQPAKENALLYLYYAQALAANGRYEEARKIYETYGSLTVDDQRGESFSKLYKDVSVLTRNVGSYQVDFLNINTNRAEFSPAFYKEGVVFVSNRKEGNGVKRVFKWNETPFLDLFQLPENVVKQERTATMGGSQTHKVKKRQVVRSLGADEYTISTSNDTRTVGFESAPVQGSSEANDKEKGGNIRLFSKGLNSPYHEGPVTFTKDFSKIYFTRNNYSNGKYRESKDGINKLKIYVARAQENGWTEEEELSFNSDEYSCGHPALKPDGKTMIFVSDKPGGFGGTDLYVTHYTKGRWSKPVNLGDKVNTKGNEMFPFVDEFGNLYFSSDGHPGLGDLDIFYVPLGEEDKPGKLYNLGAPINSAKDDFGIITDGHRKSGFFSSNRREGGADDDIYRFRREGALYACRELSLSVIDADTKNPISGAVVDMNNKLSNSEYKQVIIDSSGVARICLDPDTDFVLAAAAEGYQSSMVGFSTKDLADDLPLRLEIPLRQAAPKLKIIKGRVISQKDGTALQRIRVLLKSDCDTTTLETISEADGSYFFEVRADCNYQIEAYAPGMATTGGRLDTTGKGATDVVMFKKGDVVRIDNIYYDLSKWNIRPDAARELDKLVELMKKYPKMRIELGSHTDSRSSAAFNKSLSTKRAIAAISYIRKQGIAAARLKAVGYGESKLINHCKDGTKCTEEEHQQNRRTEFKILSLD